MFVWPRAGRAPDGPPATCQHEDIIKESINY